MGRSIICGVDGSPDSQAAAEVAAQLADRLGSTLILAHVAEPEYLPYAGAYPFGGTSGPIAEAKEVRSDEEAAARLLELVAIDAGLDAERRVVVGHPAERLAELADEEDAELIVVGSRGQGALKSAFFGSVSYSLVGIAACPVLIVPTGPSEAQ